MAISARSVVELQQSTGRTASRDRHLVDEERILRGLEDKSKLASLAPWYPRMWKNHSEFNDY
jgi:hypothetical protein